MSTNGTKASTLAVPGAALYYEVSGSGPVLLMIPGGPADADTFVDQAALLGDRYTVVRYDPRGLSRSALDQPPDELSVETQADDAHLLLAAMGGGPAYVFGSSGGAQVGLSLVASHPEQVDTLVAHEPRPGDAGVPCQHGHGRRPGAGRTSERPASRGAGGHGADAAERRVLAGPHVPRDRHLRAQHRRAAIRSVSGRSGGWPRDGRAAVSMRTRPGRASGNPTSHLPRRPWRLQRTAGGVRGEAGPGASRRRQAARIGQDCRARAGSARGPTIRQAQRRTRRR
jgi:pimeloyl-ACP methyl ester carboxylesterase